MRLYLASRISTLPLYQNKTMAQFHVVTVKDDYHVTTTFSLWALVICFLNRFSVSISKYQTDFVKKTDIRVMV